MQLLLKIYLVLLISVILFSCDPETTYIKEIQNNTEQEISIFLSGDGAIFNGDSIIVMPNSSTQYYNGFGLGRNKNYECDPRIGENDFVVVIPNGQILTKDITLSQNWNAETDKKNTFWKCTFVINPEDLE
jgi:hypothetical protein